MSDHDAVQILDTIDKIIADNFSGVNPVDFNNPEYGEKLNKMLHVFTEVNNPVVMRLNETMGVIGDNTLIKNTLEQVESQTKQYSTWKIPASISKVLLKTFLSNGRYPHKHSQNSISFTKYNYRHE